MTKRKTKHGNIITLAINDDAIRMTLHDYRVLKGRDPDYIILHPEMYKLLTKEYKHVTQLGPLTTNSLYGVPILVDSRRNSHEFEFYSKV